MLNRFNDLTRSSRFFIFSWSIVLFKRRTVFWTDSATWLEGRVGGGRSGSGGAGLVGIVCKGGLGNGFCWGWCFCWESKWAADEDDGGKGAGAIGGLQISLLELQS